MGLDGVVTHSARCAKIFISVERSKSSSGLLKYVDYLQRGQAKFAQKREVFSLFAREVQT